MALRQALVGVRTLPRRKVGTSEGGNDLRTSSKVVERPVRPRIQDSAPTASSLEEPVRDEGTGTSSGMKWVYGITTVAERRDSLLPRTLRSLSAAGFPTPRLFIDGAENIEPWKHFNLPITARYPKVRAFGNWVLSLAELLLRDGNADRYAIFEDDVLFTRNLRQYLEALPFPKRGFWNLYTRQPGHQLAPPSPNYRGWYLSNQKGKGALGLIFNRDGVLDLLSHKEHVISRPIHASDGWQWRTDTAIIEAMSQLGYKEYIHAPSLTQHTGIRSTIPRPKKRGGEEYKKWLPHTMAISFPGEEFDATELLRRNDGP